MARRKVKLALIRSDSARKATHKQRKKGLLKKVNELSTLCGVDACAIIYSPYDPQPEVWPSTLRVQRVVARFKRMSEMEQTKKMLDQETFLRQRISKINEQCRKKQIENREKEITMLMSQNLLAGKKGLQNLMLQDLNDLRLKIEEKLKEINKRAEAIKNMAPHLQVIPLPLLPPPLSSPPQPLVPVATNPVQPNQMQFAHEENIMSQWFNGWINHPMENMAFGHGGEDQTVMPNNDVQTASWPHAFYP